MAFAGNGSGTAWVPNGAFSGGVNNAHGAGFASDAFTTGAGAGVEIMPTGAGAAIGAAACGAEDDEEQALSMARAGTIQARVNDFIRIPRRKFSPIKPKPAAR